MSLLKEHERMGASNNDNLEPFMDMVQDIKVPECSETDKETAGVPRKQILVKKTSYYLHIYIHLLLHLQAL